MNMDILEVIIQPTTESVLTMLIYILEVMNK